jgi:hypothetical protein
MRGVRSVAVEAIIWASKAPGPVHRPRLLARLLASARAYFAWWARCLN